MSLLTLSDVAEMLKRSTSAASHWLREKNVPYLLIGKSRRWQQHDVLTVIESEKIKPASKDHTPKKIKRYSPIMGKSNADVLQSMGY